MGGLGGATYASNGVLTDKEKEKEKEREREREIDKER